MRREYGLDPHALSRYTLRELQAVIDDHNAQFESDPPEPDDDMEDF